MNTIQRTAEFDRWLGTLRDPAARQDPAHRLHAAAIIFTPQVGEGERDADHSMWACWRLVYFPCAVVEAVYLLLAGGDKSTQTGHTAGSRRGAWTQRDRGTRTVQQGMKEARRLKRQTPRPFYNEEVIVVEYAAADIQTRDVFHTLVGMLLHVSAGRKGCLLWTGESLRCSAQRSGNDYGPKADDFLAQSLR